ncbi:MAG: hypothetical protein HYV09_32500 [Deltaproteobacteria bacterium]|nr:hypothetical protein [Deltaproteobacteria bacterium]
MPPARDRNPVVQILFLAASLPHRDQLRIAAAWRFGEIARQCDDSAAQIAEYMGISRRHAERLRAAFGHPSHRPERAQPAAKKGAAKKAAPAKKAAGKKALAKKAAAKKAGKRARRR